MNTSTPNNCQKCGKPILEGSPRGLCPMCLISAVAKSDEPLPTNAPSPELDDLRRVFPQLEILEPLGAGGMGRVYKVRQPNLDRVVALKLLPPAYAADPEWIERFTREARALARLNHPNIVQVFDFGETAPDETGQRFPFLLMEYVDGVNLRQALRTGALTSREALTIVPSVCAALQYAHDQGVLHRDIKPENILLDTLGRVKIADFGLAKLHGDSAPGLTLTGTGAQLGTAAYMAPEQIEKPHDVDHRADIYSLGVVFYELLTGELPLGRFPAPSEKSGTDPRLDTIVFRTLEKERDRRFQTATAMQTAVENVASHPSPEPAPPAPAAPVPASPHRRPTTGQHVFLVLASFCTIGMGLAARTHFVHPGIMFVLVVLLCALAKAWPRFFGNAKVPPSPAVNANINPWPRRIFLLIVTLIVVPAVLIAVGLIVPYFAARSPRAVLGLSPAADVVTPERAPFIGRLPEGTIELAAVSHHPATGEAWWKMDGSLTTAGELPNHETDMTAQFGERAFTFLFRVNNLPKGTRLLDWEVSNSTGWSIGDGLALGTGSEPRLAGQDSVIARLPSTLSATDIRAGFGFGEWTTIFEAGTQNVGGVSPTHEGVLWKLGWSSTIETKDGTIISNWNAPLNRDWETRVVAVKKDGTIVPTNNHTRGQSQTEWRFSDVPMFELNGFAFQVRRVQWIEFRGIKLAPTTLEK